MIAMELRRNHCRQRDLWMANSMLRAHHLLNADDLRKHGKDLHKLRREKWERPSRNQQRNGERSFAPYRRVCADGCKLMASATNIARTVSESCSA
jgi:hypothetical protein